MTITCYKDLFNPKCGAFHLDVERVFTRIKNGSSKELLESIRNETDKEKRNDLKKKLPCFLFSGKFNQRKDDALEEHSGLICLDFDGFPDDEIFQTWRDTLEASEFTMAVFTSPSGNGLKMIVKIPKCDKEEHKLYFTALEKHFDCEYFDTSCKNVSRVCYESYDPTIFINNDSKEWTKKHSEQGYSFFERAPQIILEDTKQISDRLLVWWNREYGLVDGNRNNNLFILASALNNYGINQDIAESIIIHDVVRGAMKDHEITTTVRSAYKKRNEHGTKYFEDRDTFRKIELQVKKGVSAEEIKKATPTVDDETIKHIKENSTEIVFWQIIEGKTGQRIVIDNILFKHFLETSGFYKYYPEKADSPVFVHISSNIVKTSSAQKIKDFVLNYLFDKEELKIWNFLASSTKYFQDLYLSFLDSIDLEMIQDTKDKCFLYYQNGVVEVQKDNKKLLEFIDCDGYIWDDQIIKRNFIESETVDNDFKSFVQRVCADDPKRINTMETVLGYLMSSYKDKTDQKAIIFNDQEINDHPNGGSGKSLVLTALSQFKKMVKIDGKVFDPNKGEFNYQRISVDTQILAFDDVKKKFNFESLFSLITEGISVNRKNKDEIFIPFEKSPKIVITTNYVINGAGSSHDRRRFEVEFFQYFNQHRTPLTEFGKLLFDQWELDDWVSFDQYMIECLQKFLNFGLISTESINANAKRFIQNTSKEFWDWVTDDNLQLDCKIYPSEVVNEFKEEYPDFRKSMTNKLFSSWVKKYCDFKGFEYKPFRTPRRGCYIKTEINPITRDGDSLPF